MDENKSVRQSVVIKNRSQLTIDGVINVEGFDEGYVSILSAGGRIIVEGAELKIESLTKSDGVILICGRVDAVIYSDEKPHQGFFKRKGK